MNIVVFAPYTINTPHYETQLEIIQQHLDQGDNVTFLGCDAQMRSCDVNPQHDLQICMSCMGKRKHGLSLLSKKIQYKSFYKLTPQNKEELANLRTDFADIEELKAYKINEFDIGYGVSSSLISLKKIAAPEIQANKQLVHRYLYSSLMVYRSVQNHLDDLQADMVYLYNGRYAPLRAAMRACQSRHVKFYVHEVGHTINHFALWECTIPHDVNYTINRIQEKWATAKNIPEREAIGAKFYTDRAMGVEYVYLSFTKEQKEGLLPANWHSTKNNIVLFNSSEYEFASIGDEWKGIIYHTQQEGILKIINSLKADNSTNCHLYIRMHPNLKDVMDPSVTFLLDLKEDFLTVIKPEDPISTYALIQNANKVLTFSSTVGIEAVYWGKPSILLGMNYYRNLGGTYNPTTHDEVMQLIHAYLPPKAKEAALMYGYYMNTYGIPFKYYQTDHIFKGIFKGVQVNHGPEINYLIKKYHRHRRLRRAIFSLSKLIIKYT